MPQAVFIAADRALDLPLRTITVAMETGWRKRQPDARPPATIRPVTALAIDAGERRDALDGKARVGRPWPPRWRCAGGRERCEPVSAPPMRVS